MRKIINFLYKYRYWIFLIIMYVIFFLQMKNILIYDDDFDVKYPIYLDQSLQNKIDWILSKMNFFWFEWSGRIIGHFIVTSGLTLFDLNFYIILNPIFVFLTAFVCSKILGLFIENFNFIKSLCLNSLLIISMNIFLSREILYWAYAGILYLWGFLLVLLIFYLLYKYNLKKEIIPIKMMFIISLLIICESFILEQLSLIVIGILFVFYIEHIVLNKKNNFQYLFLIILAITCFLISYLAPGNAVRIIALEENRHINLDTFSFIISKVLTFFKFLFDKKCCGLYIIFLSLILIFKTIKDGLAKKIYLIPVIILCVGNILYLFIECFKFFDLWKNYDSLVFDFTNTTYNKFMVIFYIIFSIIYILSLIFLMFKTNGKNSYKLIMFYIIALGSTFIPIIFIQYIGTRYCLPILIINNVLIIYYFIKYGYNIMIFPFLIMLPFIIPYQLPDIIIILFEFLVLILFLIIYKKKIVINIKNLYFILCIIYLCVLFTTIFKTCYYYKHNKEIADYNEQILINADSNSLIYLKRIEEKEAVYAWHTFFTDYNGLGIYYTYLHKLIKQYYGINPAKIVFIK